MKLSLTQRALRPVLNFLVERFFPTGAFHGNHYLHSLSADTQLAEKWGSAEMACAMFITSRLRKLGATEATFKASDVTDCGVPVGSWLITVEKVQEPGK